MTLQELQDYLVLLKNLERARESLLDLQDAAVPGSQVLTGMPHVDGVRDKVGDLAVEIADTKTAIEKMEAEAKEREAVIDAFIQSIPNVELRTIFRLRYIRILSWEDIAEVFNWRYTGTALRKRVNSYMSKTEATDGR